MKVSSEQIHFILIHGLFDKSSGINNVEKLIPIIKEYYPNATIDQDECDYGWMGALKASWFYKLTDVIPRMSKALKDTGKRTVVIAHSNGCNFTMKALSEITNKNIELFFLSPALKRKYEFKEDFKSCDVIYTRGDSVVLLTWLLIKSRLGTMGRYGASTQDKRVNNKDMYEYGIKDHSDYFLDFNHETTFKPIRDKLNHG